MKITVELSDDELAQILKMSGESKKGPAIRKVLADAMMLNRRVEIAQKFISGEWGVELEGFEEDQEAEKRESEELATKWRD